MYLSLRPPSRSPGGQGINIDLDTMVKPWYDRREKKCHGMTEGRKRQSFFEFFINVCDGMLAVEERGKFVDPLTFSFRKRGMTL